MSLLGCVAAGGWPWLASSCCGRLRTLASWLASLAKCWLAMAGPTLAGRLGALAEFWVSISVRADLAWPHASQQPTGEASSDARIQCARILLTLRGPVWFAIIITSGRRPETVSETTGYDIVGGLSFRRTCRLAKLADGGGSPLLVRSIKKQGKRKKRENKQIGKS